MIIKEENRIKAQTRAGMFLRKVAKPRTNFGDQATGDTRLLAKRDVKKARSAATVVAERAMQIVVRIP